MNYDIIHNIESQTSYFSLKYTQVQTDTRMLEIMRYHKEVSAFMKNYSFHISFIHSRQLNLITNLNLPKGTMLIYGVTLFVLKLCEILYDFSLLS